MTSRSKFLSTLVVNLLSVFFHTLKSTTNMNSERQITHRTVDPNAAFRTLKRRIAHLLARFFRLSEMRRNAFPPVELGQTDHLLSLARIIIHKMVRLFLTSQLLLAHSLFRDCSSIALLFLHTTLTSSTMHTMP